MVLTDPGDATDPADDTPLVGEPITFAGACNGTALTDATGVAWVSDTSTTGCGLYAINGRYEPLCPKKDFTASFAGDGTYAPAAA